MRVMDPFAISTIVIVATALAAWATHIIWVITTLISPSGATLEQMVLGAIGAWAAPVGVVHGLMIWFGAGL